MLAASVAIAAEPPGSAVPLTAAELLQVYGGKTWQWGEGGGYFDLQGRKFTARTVGDAGEVTAAGTWKITDRGKLCFSAKWGATSGKAPVETCFEHMTDGGNIYQRRLPSGNWYIFKHAKTEPSDEFGKIVRGDILSRNTEAN